jgi:hypothetical protein
MKFGPFEWLRLDDEIQMILGQDVAEVAKKTDSYWRVPSERGEGMPISNPTMTNSPQHPHRDVPHIQQGFGNPFRPNKSLFSPFSQPLDPGAMRLHPNERLNPDEATAPGNFGDNYSSFDI